MHGLRGSQLFPDDVSRCIGLNCSRGPIQQSVDSFTGRQANWLYYYDGAIMSRTQNTTAIPLREKSRTHKDRPHPQTPHNCFLSPHTHTQPCTTTLLTKPEPSTVAPPAFRGEGRVKRKKKHQQASNFRARVILRRASSALRQKIAICFTERNFSSALNKALRQQTACSG